jgi:hypothetical protein
MPRCQSGPGAQLGSAGEAGDVAELGDEHASEDPPNTMDGLDSFVAGMAAQHLVAAPLKRKDLLVRRSRRTHRGSSPPCVRRRTNWSRPIHLTH